MGSHAALRLALRDFSAPPASPPRALAATVLAPAPEPKPDTATLIAQAVAEAEAALSTRLVAAHAEELARLRASHEAAMAAQLEMLGTETSERIAMGFTALARNLSGEMEGAVAQLLASFLDRLQAQRAATTLCQAIGDSVGTPGEGVLALRGPDALRALVEPALAAKGFTVRWETTDGFDMEARLGASLWRTRIGEWRDGLDAALEGAFP